MCVTSRSLLDRESSFWNPTGASAWSPAPVGTNELKSLGVYSSPVELVGRIPVDEIAAKSRRTECVEAHWSSQS